MALSGSTSAETNDPYAGVKDATSYVHLSLLDGGSFNGQLDKLHAGAPEQVFRMYNWAFYISHNGRHILWDLGMTEEREYYTPWVQRCMFDVVDPVGPRISIPEQLRKRRVNPDEVDAVIFSHAHWDHCRPISDTFPNATAFFGPGTKEGCAPGHLVSGKPDPNVQWDGRFFDPENATERWEELQGPWVPFGPFDKAMDFFGDGSFWVIQAPGHLSGNLCAAVRVESGDWVLLGSDCCHSKALLNGEQQIAVFPSPQGGDTSLHIDIPAAMETMARIRLLEKEHGFHIALSHDATFLVDGKDSVLMSLLDDNMRLAAKERIPKEERP